MWILQVIWFVFHSFILLVFAVLMTWLTTSFFAGWLETSKYDVRFSPFWLSFNCFRWSVWFSFFCLGWMVEVYNHLPIYWVVIFWQPCRRYHHASSWVLRRRNLCLPLTFFSFHRISNFSKFEIEVKFWLLNYVVRWRRKGWNEEM